jgi:ParB-like chromosome segregation protein Spo0J
VAQLNGELDEAHALLVRPNGKGYEIISRHHRRLAAERAGIKQLPCWVREMSDEDAYMALALCNAQGELHPLEVGLHALRSGLSIRGYAEVQGAKPGTIQDRVEAAKVADACRHMPTVDLADSWRHLAEIHAAPLWLWPALVPELVKESWTVHARRILT